MLILESLHGITTVDNKTFYDESYFFFVFVILFLLSFRYLFHLIIKRRAPTADAIPQSRPMMSTLGIIFDGFVKYGLIHGRHTSLSPHFTSPRAQPPIICGSTFSKILP